MAVEVAYASPVSPHLYGPLAALFGVPSTLSRERLCRDRLFSMKVEEADPDRYGNALATTAAVTMGASLFGLGINEMLGVDKALQFFAGYVVELSLSVDNLFVFLLLFKFFQVPFENQPRVLTYGILGAVVMRAIFIGLGEAAMSVFHPILLGFAAILIFSSYTLLVEGEDEEEDLSDNKLIAFASSALDATDSYDGANFFTMVDGVRRATPLLLVLACIELSDIIFAVDSIPAVFAVTKDPFIVYTSNIWAILNLRSLFTLLSSAVEDLVYLRPAVAIVLGFVGAKIGGEFFGFDVSTELSLGVITGLLGGGIGLSLLERQAGA
eukprot:g11410.t1